MEKNVLLHHCCAVCSPKVIEELRKAFAEVTGFWYNPNIFPADEQLKRKNALLEYSKQINYTIIEKPEETADFFDLALGKDIEEPLRCRICYQIRLKETALEAKRKHIQSFSTTLLSSPYQKHEIIKSCGESIAAELNIKFYYKDFRPAFYKGKQEIYERKLYMQKYCGCRYSIKTVDK
ncbi:MAG: hypothetical protein A2252_08520 [Elusimicrobia bacterium RIFOXYA2_FULL_39_19]|nr:MAG: hypothetical protein A2252_08520 [Elusimicrobia bacterium RIFOXYA2_FULL_39_19]